MGASSGPDSLRWSPSSLLGMLAGADADAHEDAVDLAAVFDACGAALYRYFAVRAGGDTHLADDQMQQLWLQASAATAPAASADDVERWLFGIARNLIRGHWRSTRRRPPHRPIADPALAAELAGRLVDEELPGAVLQRREVREQLLLAITELPSRDQALILGCYFDGRSQAELAAATGLSVRAIEGRLYRARQALKEKLEHLEP